MNRRISLRVAAQTLQVPRHVLARWVTWFGVLSPDENGRVTPQQLFEFMQSDWKWLLPAAKLPKDHFFIHRPWGPRKASRTKRAPFRRIRTERLAPQPDT